MLALELVMNLIIIQILWLDAELLGRYSNKIRKSTHWITINMHVYSNIVL